MQADCLRILSLFMPTAPVPLFWVSTVKIIFSACASFLGIDGKNYLLGMSFSDIWGDNGAKWLNIYTKTALEGLT